MELLGQPFSIQNTTGNSWLVTWTDAVVHGPESDPTRENVSFTVAIPKNEGLSIGDVQRMALKRAVHLLQYAIQKPD